MVILYRIQEKEENHFKLTNSFSTVDSRSPKNLSEEYTCIQHHDRLAAARTHKKAHVGCNPVPFHQHTMVVACAHIYVHANMPIYMYLDVHSTYVHIIETTVTGFDHNNISQQHNHILKHYPDTLTIATHI